MDLNTIVILAAAVILILAAFIGVPLLLRKTHVPLQQYMDTAKQLLDIVQGLAVALPLGKNANLVEQIIKYATLGTQYAEQLYVTGQITDPMQRKAAAITFVLNALAHTGYQLSDGEKIFIADVVEAVVYLLPKTVHPVPVVSTTPQN
jgi:hypothetical protein